MATFVQSTGAFATTSATNIAKAYTGNVVSGNLLVACCMLIMTPTPVFSVTDSQGNVWAASTTQIASSGGQRAQIFWTKAGSSAANTVTFTRTTAASTDERILIIGEFGAITAADPNDNSNTGTATSANPSVSVVGGAAASLIVAAVCTGGTATGGAGFSDMGGQDGNDGEYKLAPGSGSIAALFSSASATWAEAAATYVDSIAGSAARPLRRFPFGV